MRQIEGFIAGLALLAVLFYLAVYWISKLAAEFRWPQFKQAFVAFKPGMRLDSRTAMNHAIEHKMHRILKREVNVRGGAWSDEKGFQTYGLVNEEIVAKAAQQSMDELKQGIRPQEAYSLTCGSSDIAFQFLGVIGLVISFWIGGFSFWSAAIILGLMTVLSGIASMVYQRRFRINPKVDKAAHITGVYHENNMVKVAIEYAEPSGGTPITRTENVPPNSRLEEKKSPFKVVKGGKK